MSDLWFPGRPPMCSEELLWDLTQLAETILSLIDKKDSSYIEVANHIVGEALHLIHTEGEGCLHTDQTLNKLKAFFEEVGKTSLILYKNAAWPELQELATNVLIVRNELEEQLTLVTHTRSNTCL